MRDHLKEIAHRAVEEIYPLSDRRDWRSLRSLQRDGIIQRHCYGHYLLCSPYAVWLWRGKPQVGRVIEEYR